MPWKFNPFTGNLDLIPTVSAETDPVFTAAVSAFGLTLIDDADAATARTTLGLVAGGAGDIWVEKAGDTMTGQLFVDGSSDQIQLRVQGHSSQTSSFFTIEDSAGIYKLNFDKNGYFRGGIAAGANVVATLYAGAAAVNSGVALNFNMLYGAGASYPTWSLAQIYAEYVSASGWPGELVFKTNDSTSATNLTERMRIKYNGTIVFPVGTLMTGLGQLQLAVSNASISTTLGEVYFLGIGNDATFGANKYFGIGLGYKGPAASYYYPSMVAYQETFGGGETYGDLVFATRGNQGQGLSKERLRINHAGAVSVIGTNDVVELTVNSSPDIVKTISTISITSNVCTITFTAEHGMAVGDTVIIAGATAVAGINGTQTITNSSGTSVTAITFLYVAANLATTAETGTGTVSQTKDVVEWKDGSGNVRRAWSPDLLDLLIADQTTDTAPNDDTTLKKMTLQKLASPPSNAAYVAFSNNPGTDTFYLVLEEA